MDKELQDQAWANAPAEFRKEARERYAAMQGTYNNREAADVVRFSNGGALSILNELFGKHNLTSDTEPEGQPEQFKVGDKVVIRKDAASLHQGYQNGYAWLPGRDKYVGKSFTVTKVHSDGRIELDIPELIYWEAVDLEPYAAPTDNAEEKELDLCELLKGHEGETFYCTMFGKVPFVSIIPNPAPFEKPIKIDAFQLTSDGKYGIDGECILFPSRALYEQYPLEPQRAWAVWSEQQKPTRWRADAETGEEYWYVDIDSKIFTAHEGMQMQDDDACYGFGNYFRTKSDAEFATSEMRKTLERVHEELNGNGKEVRK